MTAKVAISFDDGLGEQFQWAIELYKRDIVGTFYINPMTVGHGKILTLEQLKGMHDSMHHIVANHLWSHIAPVNGATIDDAIGGFQRAGMWLTVNGFADGCDLLALPYGSVGGEWTNEQILRLSRNCSQIRDVTNGINALNARKFVGAVESSDFACGDDVLILHYFHGHKNTSDDEFISFLDALTISNVEVTSMRKIADGRG